MIWQEIKTSGKTPFDTPNGEKKSIYGHCCSVWGNKILIYGGKHDKEMNSSVWMLDLGMNKIFK